MMAYDLLLSVPSDLAECVPLLKNVISEFNNHFGREHNIVVRPVYWKDDAYPTTGDSPQGIINKQIADSSDIILACFWTRFGSPTEGYGSGTEEEIERARTSGRQVFLYFIDKPVSPSQIDRDQLSAIADYKRRCQSSGLFAIASDEKRLADDFRQKIELYFTTELNRARIIRTSTSKRVLWVDDRPENNSYLRNLMETYGIEFSLALSTKEALRLISHQSYALLISDMGRKEGPREGYVLLDVLRESSNNTPLLFFTASGAPEDIAETLAHGGQGCTSEATELMDLVFKILIGGAPSDAGPRPR